jgi:hypothetical protein
MVSKSIGSFLRSEEEDRRERVERGVRLENAQTERALRAERRPATGRSDA